MEWFEELSVGRSHKATAVYTVVAWSLLQAIDIIAPAFNAPQWLNQTLILITTGWLSSSTDLSWMFNFSFIGLRRSSPETQSNKPSVSRKDYFFAASIAVLVLLVIGQQLTLFYTFPVH